jgi:hypothetical protein
MRHFSYRLTCTAPRRQVLEKQLSKLQQEQEDRLFSEHMGSMMVPPHMVNLRLGNRHHIMLRGGKSFNKVRLAEILLRAGVVPQAVFSGKGEDFDKLALVNFQHEQLVWEVSAHSECVRNSARKLLCGCVVMFLYGCTSM